MGEGAHSFLVNHLSLVHMLKVKKRKKRKSYFSHSTCARAFYCSFISTGLQIQVACKEVKLWQGSQVVDIFIQVEMGHYKEVKEYDISEGTYFILTKY